MATIKTIKPGGGGDFTSLASWFAWASIQSSPAQWAECYSGNVGPLAMGSPSWDDPTDTDYPRIYVAEGHGHNGSFDSNKAYVQTADSSGNNTGIGLIGGVAGDPKFAYMRIEGLQINGWTGSGTYYPVAMTLSRTLPTLIVDGILAVNVACGINIAWGWQGHVRNCIFRGRGGTTNLTGGGSNYGIYGFNVMGSGQATAIEIHLCNNTISNFADKGIYVDLDSTGGGENATGEIRNNIIWDVTNDAIKVAQATGAADQVTKTHNMTDAAGGLDGSTASWTSQNMTGIFENAASDWRLATGSSALDVGYTVSSFSTDALGTTRPVGDAWDLGAIELAGASAGGPPAGCMNVSQF